MICWNLPNSYLDPIQYCLPQQHFPSCVSFHALYTVIRLRSIHNISYKSTCLTQGYRTMGSAPWISYIHRSCSILHSSSTDISSVPSSHMSKSMVQLHHQRPTHLLGQRWLLEGRQGIVFRPIALGCRPRTLGREERDNSFAPHLKGPFVVSRCNSQINCILRTRFITNPFMMI